MRLMILCASLMLAGCYTTEYLYVFHPKHGVCEKRKVTDSRTLSSTRVSVLPLMECDGFIGISPEEFAKMRGKNK